MIVEIMFNLMIELKKSFSITAVTNVLVISVDAGTKLGVVF